MRSSLCNSRLKTSVPLGRGAPRVGNNERRRAHGEGFEKFWRKMVCWGGVRPRPGPRLPPLEGGGRQPCTGLLDVLPPVRKSPVRRAAAGRVRCALTCRQDCGPCGGAGVAQTHGAVDRAHAADVRRVCDRPRDRPARCLRLCCRRSASVAVMMSSAGTMHVDALGPVPPLQPQ